MYPILDFYEMLKKKASILVTKSSFGFTLDLKNMFTFDKPLELLRVIVNIHWVDFFVVCSLLTLQLMIRLVILFLILA